MLRLANLVHILIGLSVVVRSIQAIEEGKIAHFSLPAKPKCQMRFRELFATSFKDIFFFKKTLSVTEIPSGTHSTSDKPTDILDHDGESNSTVSSKNETATADESEEATNTTKERLIRLLEQRLNRFGHIISDCFGTPIIAMNEFKRTNRE